MKFSIFYLSGALLASSFCGVALAEEKVAVAAPAEKHVSGEPFKDAIIAFDAAYTAAVPLFSNAGTEKPDFRACAKSAEKLDELSDLIRKIHEDRLRQFGLAYHEKLELLVIDAHRLKLAVLEHSREDIVTHWSNLTTVRNQLAQTKPWQ